MDEESKSLDWLKGDETTRRGIVTGKIFVKQ